MRPLLSTALKPRQGGLHAGLRERLLQLEVLGGLPHLGQDVTGEDQGGGRAGGGRVQARGRRLESGGVMEQGPEGEQREPQESVPSLVAQLGKQPQSLRPVGRPVSCPLVSSAWLPHPWPMVQQVIICKDEIGSAGP